MYTTVHNTLWRSGFRLLRLDFKLSLSPAVQKTSSLIVDCCSLGVSEMHCGKGGRIQLVEGKLVSLKQCITVFCQKALPVMNASHIIITFDSNSALGANSFILHCIFPLKVCAKTLRCQTVKLQQQRLQRCQHQRVRMPLLPERPTAPQKSRLTPRQTWPRRGKPEGDQNPNLQPKSRRSRK